MNDLADILLISAGPVHPSWLARYRLRRALKNVPGIRLHHLASLESLPQRSLETTRALILYFHQQRLSPQALAALDSFVREGGGLLAVHSASASFKETDAYFDILGGRFTHHGPVQPIHVEPAAGSEIIFGHVPAFSVTDELYRHRYESGNQVHFYARVEGETEPIVWTRQYGQGRICYCSLGHRADVPNHPAVQQILRRGLIWAGRLEGP